MKQNQTLTEPDHIQPNPDQAGPEPNKPDQTQPNRIKQNSSGANTIEPNQIPTKPDRADQKPNNSDWAATAGENHERRGGQLQTAAPSSQKGARNPQQATTDSN